MRNLSIGATMYLLFAAGVLLSGPLLLPAAAQSGITLGFAISEASVHPAPEQSEALGRYLEARLAIPVKIRSFASDEQLYTWLTRYREVDIAWLESAFFITLPAGQLQPMVDSLGADGQVSHGVIVTRSGLNDDVWRQTQSAFLQMHEDSAGEALLARLGLSRYVEPGKPPTPLPAEASLVEGTLTPPPATGMPSLPLAGITALSLDAKTPISLSADALTYQSADDSYEATGAVVLRQGSVELQAETMLWQAATQDAAASGAVQLREAGAEVHGEHLQYNLATGQGQIRNGSVFVHEGNFRLAGEQIEKLGETEFRVEKGSFTTCDGVIPDWKFSAAEVDVTLGGYATAKNVWFHVRDVPVLYTPYLFFPVKTERESGLLSPWFGYSDSKGLRASLAWYQVLDRHLDATLYLDYLEKVGLGKGLEYRYALANQNNGRALYYHVTGLSAIPDLFYLEWDHQGELPGGWKLTADVNYTDDRLFFEEFGETAESYRRDKVVSSLMLRRNWDKLNLVGFSRYLRDLENSNDATLQRLPELSLALNRYRFGGTPFYLGLESYATHFSRSVGEDGERLYLRPSVAASFKPGDWLEVIPELALHERLYETDSGREEQAVIEASLTLATRLVKTYAVDSWGMTRVQHSIEPSLKYTHMSDQPQSSLPQFDSYDQVLSDDFYNHIQSQNVIGYSVINRLIGRSTTADGVPAYREFLNLRLSQTYDIDEARHNQSGQNQPLSDLQVELAFLPTDNFTLEVDSLVPVYGATRFNRLSVNSSLRDNRGNAVRLDYVYRDEVFTGVASDYIGFQLETSLFQPVFVRVEERYDIKEKKELEKVFGFEYRSKCWSLLLTYRNRYRESGGDDHEVMLNFVLAGLSQNNGFSNGFERSRH